MGHTGFQVKSHPGVFFVLAVDRAKPSRVFQCDLAVVRLVFDGNCTFKYAYGVNLPTLAGRLWAPDVYSWMYAVSEISTDTTITTVVNVLNTLWARENDVCMVVGWPSSMSRCST